MATLLQKLGEYYPVREKDGVSEFYYHKVVSGITEQRLYRSFDMGNSYIETKYGKDWTKNKIKPKSPLSRKVGIIIQRPYYYIEELARGNYFRRMWIDDCRRAWIGIIQTLIVENLQMETPIHIEQVKDGDKGTIRTIGWVFAHKNGENIL